MCEECNFGSLSPLVQMVKMRSSGSVSNGDHETNGGNGRATSVTNNGTSNGSRRRRSSSTIVPVTASSTSSTNNSTTDNGKTTTTTTKTPVEEGNLLAGGDVKEIVDSKLGEMEVDDGPKIKNELEHMEIDTLRPQIGDHFMVKRSDDDTWCKYLLSLSFFLSNTVFFSKFKLINVEDGSDKGKIPK